MGVPSGVITRGWKILQLHGGVAGKIIELDGGLKKMLGLTTGGRTSWCPQTLLSWFIARLSYGLWQISLVNGV